MKRSRERIFSACLLLGIALALSVGLLCAVSSDASSATAKSEDDTYIWVRLLMNTDAAVREIRLYTHAGEPLQTLQVENGTAVSDLMMPGTYFAATEQGCTEFVLHKNASVSVSCGCGWSDGEQLYLTDEQVGSVTVERFASERVLTEDGGWIDYTLVNAKTRLREVVRCSGPQELLTCVFAGVPYGDYVLEENGIAQCHVTLSEAVPEISVTLP